MATVRLMLCSRRYISNAVLIVLVLLTQLVPGKKDEKASILHPDKSQTHIIMSYLIKITTIHIIIIHLSCILGLLLYLYSKYGYFTHEC